MLGKLSIDGSGRVTGTCPNGRPVIHNDPFPCINGTSGGMGPKSAIRGLIGHTMVGNSAGTQQVFNQPGFDASAHFLNDQHGQLIQMGPFGPGRWKAWAESAGNFAWFSVESADAGDANNPYTQPQLLALAQLLELASRPAVGNFPMQITNSTGGLGLGVHNMGGLAWGGHSCPDLPPRHVRSNQRGQIIAFARELRGSAPPHKPPAPPEYKLWTAEGMMSLAGLATQLKTSSAAMVAMTAEHASPHAVFTAGMSGYLDGVFGGDAAKMGPGLTWHYAAGRADKEWVTNPGNQSLSALAAQLKNSVSTILRMTCERSPQGLFAPNVAAYINGVASRSTIHVPHGTVLAYP